MEPGWLVLLISLFVQMFFTVLLVAPLPSNAVRGFLVEAVQSLTEKPGVKYAVWGTLALNIFYFWYTIEGLTHMGRDLGILSPVEYAISCEAKQDMFRQERNALICGASLFLWFVLRRLVDIQGKLHESRDAQGGGRRAHGGRAHGDARRQAR